MEASAFYFLIYLQSHAAESLESGISEENFSENCTEKRGRQKMPQSTDCPKYHQRGFDSVPKEREELR